MSRIHDALRRAEEQIRTRGPGSPPETDTPEQDLEILEVLRVTDDSSFSDSAPIASVDASPNGAGAGEEDWMPQLPSLDPEPVAKFPAPMPMPVPAPPPVNKETFSADRPPAMQPRLDGRPFEERAVLPMLLPGKEPAPIAPSRPESAPSSGPSDAPIKIEDLLARCRVTEWKPDAEHMLSFDIRATNPVGLEEFRTLRSRLYQLRERHALSRLLITSSLPGEGKTFVSANLAQVIVRQRGRRALLIDCDLRLSRLHQVLGAPVTPGLTDYLRGEADEFEIIQRGPLENLFFVPGGRQVSNPADLLAGNRLARLLDRLSPTFDWIIVDTPPAVPIADASVIAQLCHGVLMVVSSASTPFDLAQKACKEFRHTPIVGAVLNRVPRRATYSRYYYQGYEPQGKGKG